ncbi:MAG: GH92 family glycosyl hydrolase [Pseudomonadota bacterium]
MSTFFRQVARAALVLLLTAGACNGGGGEEFTCPDACTGGPEYTPPQQFVPPEIVDLVRYVDPMIGTQGSGNVIPGALVPHGMVRLSPDTVSGGGSVSAYEYGDTRVRGFSHTHLEGAGGSGNGYSEILVMAGAGELDVMDPSSQFSHDDERAEPGYYSVRLSDPGIDVELTAAAHAGFHRYTFPARDDAWMVIDLGNSLGLSKGGSIEVIGSNTVRGMGQYDVNPLVSLMIGPWNPTAQAKVYFHAEFSRPFKGFGTYGPDGMVDGERAGEGKEIGAFLRFDAAENPVVEVRVGISMVSMDQACRNMRDELGEDTFETIRENAKTAWNDKLNRVRIEADEDVLTQFYTALYHSMFQPANYAEAGGCFTVATSGQFVEHNEGGRPYYTDDWCMWDTYRTLHPLGTLIEPEIRSDIVRSMLTMYEEGGWLPKCTWHASGYSRVMTGNPQIAVIADAWIKGFTDFDTDLAWEAMLKTSMEEVEDPLDSLCGYYGLGTPLEYIESGYVGHECDGTQAASMTLEIAYADSCMADVAGLTGRTDDEEVFRERAQNFRNHWNPDTGFMQSRYRDGEWVEDFDPADTSDFNGFCEASSWIFSFFVPHDVGALIELMGGAEPFVERLDQFFSEGHHDASNQPGFHIPWLYNYAGSPSKTQELVRLLLAEEFSSGPGGLPGNDDAGAMSAWTILAALGLYPVAPGQPIYTISTPLVRRATLHLHPGYFDGATFTIETEGDISDVFIQSVTLNGAELDRPFITHGEIADGGTLHLVLGPEPSDWGAADPGP